MWLPAMTAVPIRTSTCCIIRQWGRMRPRMRASHSHCLPEFTRFVSSPIQSGRNDSIIIHCSATRLRQDLRAKDIDRMRKQRGFNQIGYNFVIDLDGTVENGRPLSIDRAHCNAKGFSGISYDP